MNTQSYDIPTATAGPGVSRASIRVTFGFPDLAGQAVAFDLTNSGSPVYVQLANLSSGANTITKPASAGAVVLLPPTTNTATLTFKGVTGDTGVRLHTTAPSLLVLDRGVTTFVLTTSAAITGFQFAWL